MDRPARIWVQILEIWTRADPKLERELETFYPTRKSRKADPKRAARLLLTLLPVQRPFLKRKSKLEGEIKLAILKKAARIQEEDTDKIRKKNRKKKSHKRTEPKKI